MKKVIEISEKQEEVILKILIEANLSFDQLNKLTGEERDSLSNAIDAIHDTSTPVPVMGYLGNA